MSKLDMSIMDNKGMAFLLGLALVLGIILLLVLLEKHTGGENGGIGCVSFGVVAVIGSLVWWQATSPPSSSAIAPSRPIGVQLETINSTNAGRLGIDQGWGWYVGSVTPGSAAANAGIRQGDFLLSADGKWLSQFVSGDPLFAAKEGKPRGHQLRVWGYRDFGTAVQQYTWYVVLP